MKAKIDLFSQLLRELEADIGTRDLARLILNAVINSVKSFKAEDKDDFCEQFKDLVYLISNVEPKFGILNYNFANIFKYIKDNICKIKKTDLSENKRKKIVIKKIKEILKDTKFQDNIIKEYAENINVENKTILIHDHSHTVQDVLCHFRKLGKHFKVVIAEQDFEKTMSNIERLHHAGISFQVVPSYMLSHIHDQIDMVFFGALTLKNTMNFVMGPGTHSIISEFHMAGIPIYMFINSTKFSLWSSKERLGVFIHKHIRKHHSKPIEYERIKYSHDRIEAKLFAKIITDKGILTPSELKILFDKRLNEYRESMSTK